MTDRDLIARALRDYRPAAYDRQIKWYDDKADAILAALAAAGRGIRPLVATDEMADAGSLAVYSSGAPDFVGKGMTVCETISPLLTPEEAKQVWAAMVAKCGDSH